MNQIVFLDILKQKIQSLNADDLFEVLIYFVTGFILGLLVKYSVRYFLWFLIFGLISMWVMQNLGIVVINYEYLQHFFSLAHDYTISDLLNKLVEFARGHIGESLGLIFGFYLSWEIL